jgi:tetratricopeptide (TPR) repeat protein
MFSTRCMTTTLLALCLFAGGCGDNKRDQSLGLGRRNEIDPFKGRQSTLIDRARRNEELNTTGSSMPDDGRPTGREKQTGVITFGAVGGLTPGGALGGGLGESVVAAKPVKVDDKSFDLRMVEVNSVGADYKVQFDRGEELLKKGQFDQALVCFDEAKALNPKNYAAYVGEAFCYYRKENFGRALAAIDFAIRSAPDQTPLYSHRGNIRVMLGDQSGAIDDFTTVLNRTPDDLQTRATRASMYTQLKNYPAAVADYDALIKAQPNNVGALINRAVVYFHMRRQRDAIADATAVIKFEPRMIDAYFLRAIAYAQLNEAATGRPDYDEAVRLGLNEKAAANWRPAFYPPTPTPPPTSPKK